MIDRVVLEQVAARHLATMQSPSGVSLLVHLHGGARYTVHGFEEFLDACCVERAALPRVLDALAQLRHRTSSRIAAARTHSSSVGTSAYRT